MRGVKLDVGGEVPEVQAPPPDQRRLVLLQDDARVAQGLWSQIGDVIVIIIIINIIIIISSPTLTCSSRYMTTRMGSRPRYAFRP
jgi:hypothetical protein